jgi:hypothetical protein
MHQGSRLERLARLFAREPLRRQRSEFLRDRKLQRALTQLPQLGMKK